MFTDVAFDTLQVRVDEAPAVILFGAAPNEVIDGIPVAAGGVDGGVLVPEIMTSVEAVELPAEFEAVRVYTVVAAGATALVPLTATFPIPLSRLTLVAPVTLQLSVEPLPDVIDAGLALNEATTGFSTGVVEVGGVLGLAGK